MATKRISTTKRITRPFRNLAKEDAVSVNNVNKLNKILWIVAILAVVGAAGYFLKSYAFAAIVNGKPISRIEVVKELEKQGGKRVLDNLITQQLILDEANKQSITVTSKEVDDEVKNIENNLKSQGQDMNQLLTSQNMTLSDLKQQVEIQKKIEKMVGKNIKVTDEEVNKYMTENKSTLPQSTDEAKLKADVKSQLTQQKMGEEFQTLLESLKTKAKIQYFVTY